MAVTNLRKTNLCLLFNLVSARFSPRGQFPSERLPFNWSLYTQILSIMTLCVDLLGFSTGFNPITTSEHSNYLPFTELHECDSESAANTLSPSSRSQSVSKERLCYLYLIGAV
jgi:hypothetical protein